MAHSATRDVLDVGTVIAGTYTIEALLGRGGMGAVFVASHARLPGKRVAIKVLHAELADAELLARFQREAEIASRLGHPNIVGVEDFNLTEAGTPYLVLELLEGQTLAERIARGPMPLADVARIARQIGSALAAAHREGIVHRDLKPANVFLVPTEVGGTTIEQVKVLDFGISKIVGSQTVKTQDATLLGTPQYMAPEQARGDHAAVDERTDLFAFGAMVYEMLSGTAAFAGANVPEVVFKVVYEEPRPLAERAPGTPPAVVAAVERALRKAPAERFPNVVAFVEALTGEPLQVRPRNPSLGPRPVATAVGTNRGNPAAAGLAATVDSGRADAGVLAVAATVASAPGVAAAPTLPPEIAAPRAPTSAPRGPRRRARVAIALTLGVAAAVAATLIVTQLRAPTAPPPAPVAVAAVVVDAQPRADAARVAETSPRDAAAPHADAAALAPDAARVLPGVVTAAPRDAAPRPEPRVTVPKPPPPDAAPLAGADRATWLREAEAAVAEENWPRVDKMGSRLINDGAPRGYYYRVLAQCSQGRISGVEGALAGLRRAGLSKSEHRQLVAICLQAGLTLSR